jgi:hypothetical protein
VVIRYNKILEWAKEYGKHFCVHDVQDFFSQLTLQQISSHLTYLSINKKQLIKSANTEICKKQTKPHFFWIYNDAYKEKKRRKRRFKTRAKYNRKSHLISAVKLVRPERTARCPYCHRKVAIIELKKPCEVGL